MYACEIHFFRGKDVAQGTFVESLWTLIAALSKNGQTVNDDTILLPGKPTRYLCICPERDSLDARFRDKWGRKAFRETVKLSARPPKFQPFGEVADMPPACDCKQRPFAYLFSHFMDSSSPVKCGGCDRPVPLYRLPASKMFAPQDFLCWQSTQHDCDSLFIGSGVGEMYGYRQTANVNSKLTGEGRELCTHLEKAWKLPVYYYLHRYYGTSHAQEEKRRCPGCNGQWAMETPHRRYVFQCTKCRLLSVKAVAFDGACA